MNLGGEVDDRFRILEDEKPDLQYYLSLLITVVRKYLLWSLPVALVAGIHAFDRATSGTPTYTARTIMHVAQSSANVMNLNSYYWGIDSAFQSTQLGILESRMLMRRIVEDLQLHRRDVPPAPPKTLLQKLLPSLVPPPPEPERPKPRQLDPQAEELLVEQYAAMLRGAVVATPDSRGEYSNLINISATWHDPELAAEIANGTARMYKTLLLEKAVEQAMGNQQYLADRLADLRADLRAAEERLQRFLDERDIDPSEIAQEREVAQVSGNLLAARSERMKLEVQLQQIADAGDDIADVAVIRNDPRVASARNRLLEIDRRRIELGQRYGPKHRRMIDLESEAMAAQRTLQAEIREVIAGLRAELAMVRTNEAALQEALADASNREQGTSVDEFQLFDLQQDIEVKRGLLTAFTEMYNQGDANAPLENSNVWVVDPASPPGAASRPSVTRAVLIAVAMSVFGVLGLGALIELNRNTVGTPEELEKHLGIPHLATLPLVRTRRSDPQNLPLMQYEQRHGSYFAESIRSLRTSLLLSHASERVTRLVITSTDANEGKSSVALNLGMAFGHMKRTLIVDCDLRRPSLERALNPQNPHLAGLTDVLAGAAGLDQCLIEVDDGSLSLLPSGSRTLNPLELLSSPGFGMLLNELNDRFEVVILDTPPCMAVSDAYVVSTHADSVVFVIKARASRIPAMRTVLHRLRDLGVDVAGGVLNQVNLEATPYDTSRDAYRAYRRYSDAPSEPQEDEEAAGAVG